MFRTWLQWRKFCAQIEEAFHTRTKGKSSDSHRFRQRQKRKSEDFPSAGTRVLREGWGSSWGV
jgi:hypothetical protein